MCDQHLEAESWADRIPGQPRRRLGPQTLVEVPRCLQAIALYAPLLSAGQYRDGFVPWDGRSASAVAGARHDGENVTQPVPGHILQPLLATCLFLVDTIGPHLAGVVARYRAEAAASTARPVPHVDDVLGMLLSIKRLHQAGEPLPEISANQAGRHPARAGDPLRRLPWQGLATVLGYREIPGHLKPLLSPDLMLIAEDAGFAGAWARGAAEVAGLGHPRKRRRLRHGSR